MKNKKIQLIAQVMNYSGLNNIGLLMNRLLHGKKFIRAINYHSTPKTNIHQFEKQLQYYKRHYSNVTLIDLQNLLDGKWTKEKPGIIITFDDGLESNYKYAMPLLEKYNFTGWFFIPSGLIGTGYCEQKDQTGKKTEQYMNWEQIKEMGRNHIIGCHTLTHKRLKKNLPQKALYQEICESKMIIEEQLKREVDVFCWVGGEKHSYSREASKVISSCGYKYSFLTNHYPIKPGTHPLQLERTNVEADWSINLIKFYTSFFMDFKYKRKRKQIKKLLS